MTSGAASQGPDVSIIVPCYNEESVIGYTIPRLAKAFAAGGHRVELLMCDNGSTDRTGEIIRGFAEKGLPITPHRVEVNQGYGHGVLSSIPRCAGQWIGIIPADGQVDAEDLVRLYESVSRSDGRVVGKVFRRFRLDGLRRTIVTIFYNAFVNVLWPGLGSFDVNGSPKVMHRDVIRAMQLESKDWMLDSEILIKARAMNLRVLEMNVFARMREHGASNVGTSTIFQFIGRLLGFRFGRRIRRWRKAYAASHPAE